MVTETTPPPGYSAVTPITVLVLPGSPTPATIDVLDPVQPATVSIVKVDAESGKPLAGATFTVSYAPSPGGPYSQNLGTCVTDASGSCSPVGNDGPMALLPGGYQVTETAAPPGYLLPANPVQDLTLAPGQVGTVSFADQPMVPVAFQKVATGNYNPTQVIFAGAVIDVSEGTASGPVVTSCTTDSTGACTTTSVLDGGATYCWTKKAGASGTRAGGDGMFPSL